MPPDFDEELQQLAVSLNSKDYGIFSENTAAFKAYLKSRNVTFPGIKRGSLIPRHFPVSVDEIAEIRKALARGEPDELLAETYGVTDDVVEAIATGEAGPYAGGIIRQPAQKSGVLTEECRLWNNDFVFASGVLTMAKRLLSFEQYEVFLNFQGISQDSETKLEGMEPNERKDRKWKRYSDFLLRQSRKGRRDRPKIHSYRRRE